MAPRKKNEEEKILAKRAREKARYERNMSDPVKAQKIKNRMNANYMRRKGKEKPYCQKSDGEKRGLRKEWREKKRTYRLKKKENSQLEPALKDHEDFNAPPQEEAPTSPTTDQKILLTSSKKTPHQSTSGKKNRTRNRQNAIGKII